MKKLHKVLLSAAVTSTLIIGCDTEALHDLNLNPQAVVEIDVNFLFSSAQLGAASGGSAGDDWYPDWRTNIGMCSMAIQQIANAGGGIAPGDKYTDNQESTSAPFEYLYADQLKNIAEVLRQTGPGGYDEGNKANLRSASRIFRAFLFHRATDYYGSVPYFQALKAVDEKIFFPDYDKQKDIYADLLKELDEATGDLDETLPDEGFEAADLFYSGDISKWKKFGYSIMLRLAMRVSNRDATMADTYVQKAVAGGVFESNEDNVWVPMSIGPSQWVNQNGISRTFRPGDGEQPPFVSMRLVDWLKGTNLNSTADDDPRLMILCGGIGDWTTDGWDPITVDPLDQKGMPNGKNQAMLDAIEGHPVNQDETYTKLNPLMLDLDDPYLLMNYGEVELNLAEAAERSIGGLVPADAQAHYNAGVRASMQMYTPYDESLDIDDGAVDDYLATYPYGSIDKLRMIGEQLWVNHFFNWYEAWSDWRRTGFPVLVPVVFPGNVTGGTIPQRLKYPNSEVAANPNVVNGTSPNLYTIKVWWAGGPE